MNNDAVSIDERINDLNNLHDMRCSDQCVDLDIPRSNEPSVLYREKFRKEL